MFGNKAVALSTILRPETVVALENVPFTLRAQALPGVIEASESIDDVLLSGDNPDEDMIDVSREMRLSPDIEERMITTDKYVIAGGLCYDQDSSHLNPCELGTANGNIYHVGARRGDAEEQAKYYAALGLDSDGNKDLTLQAVSNRLVKRVMTGIRKDISVLTPLLHRLRAINKPVSMASLESVIQFAVDQEGWSCALDHLAGMLFGVLYWNRLADDLQDKLQPLADMFSESEAEQAWDEAQAAGEIGDPLAIPLDIYEHSGLAYSVTGTGMNCRWDTSRAAAVWVPDEDAIANIRSSTLTELGIGSDATLDSLMYAKAKEYCKGVLEEYNAWVNGEVYGVVMYVIDRATGDCISDHDDECWGFIGSKYAEEELESLMLVKALELGQPTH